MRRTLSGARWTRPEETPAVCRIELIGTAADTDQIGTTGAEQSEVETNLVRPADRQISAHLRLIDDDPGIVCVGLGVAPVGAAVW